MKVGDLPILRLIAPVVRTPTNLMHFAMEHTPGLNFLSDTWRADVFGGDPLRRALALGKFGAGAVLALGVIPLAMSTPDGPAAVITGGGPIDPTLAKNKRESGWQPYSIRIGDTYYSYDRLAPLGSMLGILADYAEIGGQLQEHDKGTIAQAAILAAMRNLTSHSFLESVGDVFAATHGDSGALSRLEKSIISATTPGVLKTAKRVIDPTQRETTPGADPETGTWSEARHILNLYMAQIPGFSEMLPPRRNLWGEAIETPPGWPVDLVSPVHTTTARHDPASDEIVRLGRLGLQTPGRASNTIGGADSENHPLDEPASQLKIGVRLTDAQYDKYVRLAGDELKVHGLGLHEKLNELVASDRYKSLSDPIKAAIINSVVIGYRQAAQGELLKTDPSLLDAYRGHVIQKAEALRGTVAPSGGGRVTLPSPASAPRPQGGRVVPEIR